MNDTGFVTATGLEIDLANLKPESIRIYDIAWSLSNTNRYMGHAPVQWDVLSHTGLVYALYGQDVKGQIDPLFSLVLLLHDAVEAYVGDMAWPLKHMSMAGRYLELETDINSTIMKRFDISEMPGDVDWELIRHYDRLAASVELSRLFPHFKDSKSDIYPTLVKAKITDYVDIIKYLSINNNVSNITDLLYCSDAIKEILEKDTIHSEQSNVNFEKVNTNDIERLQI